MTRTGPLLALSLVLATTVVSGCAAGLPVAADPAEAPPAEAPLPAGVGVEFMQLRSDVAQRAAQLRVINDSGDDLRVHAVRFEDDWFDGPATRASESTVAAGRAVDLRIDLPPSACEGEPTAAERASRVVLEWSSDGGVFVSAADLPDPLEVLPGLHERECLLADVEKAATMAFTSFIPSPPGSPATLELTVSPTGNGAARIAAVEPTNLLRFDPVTTGPWALELAVRPDDQDAVPVSVPIVPFRCDPHAVQEDKRGTIFPIQVAVGEATGQVELPVPPEMRGAILSWVAKWCGFGS